MKLADSSVRWLVEVWLHDDWLEVAECHTWNLADQLVQEYREDGLPARVVKRQLFRPHRSRSACRGDT